MDKSVKEIIVGQLKSNMSMYDIARFWKINFRVFKDMILQDSELSVVYFTYKENRAETLRKKKKEQHKCCFNSPLNINGCINLASGVLKRALNDCDVRFFESDDFVFYQQFIPNTLDSSDYINAIINSKNRM